MNEAYASQVKNSTQKGASYELQFSSQLVNWEDNIVGTYLGIVFLLALILNFLVIYTCLRNWKSLLMSDYYILNLACSDTILPMTAFPLPISSSFFHRWMFEEPGCVVYGFLGFFFGLVSITTLTIMGLTRYISVCHPQIRIASIKFTKNTIIFPYVYALVWSSIPLSGWGSYSVESYGTSCTLQWNDNKVFITLMSVFCISTPSAVMFFSYTMILLKCRKSNRNLREWRSRNATKVTRKESYLIKITFAMCWGFLICWMPYAVVSMWTAYGDVTYLPVRATVVAVLLAKTSTVVNPVIYFLMSNKFRPLLMKSLNMSRSSQREIQRNPRGNDKTEVPIQRLSKCSNTGSSNATSDSSSSGAKLVRQVMCLKLRASAEDVAL
ncbi:opsin-5-like [Ruditapes philippinarum]|uniref:opsin-5-like n=1 Tax=Ruditapes philippinarum TaxID=129788 RepID=UPI00295B104F|nr:opsin-5-like [Ruditapes philippinarum]